MLILTRRVGETIVIGDNQVRIKVVAVRGRQVRLQFDAPPEVAIMREEKLNVHQDD